MRCQQCGNESYPMMFVTMIDEVGNILAQRVHSLPRRTEKLSADVMIEITDETLQKIIGPRVRIAAHTLAREPER